MKKKRIAFVFMSMPHGHTSAEEGFDLSLATCILTDQLGVFFVSDGVFLLLSDQNPNIKFSKNFMSSFEILLLCGIKNIYLCADSAFDRGLTKKMNWISKKEIIWLSLDHWRFELLSYDFVLRF